jgi:NADH-quinone oxidoreductase subunit M
VIIAALYMLWAYQRSFHGEPDEANTTFPDLNLGEKLVILPLIGLMVFLGVYPKPLLERIEPSVTALIVHVERQVPGFEEPRPEREGEPESVVATEHGEHGGDATTGDDTGSFGSDTDEEAG